MSGFGEWYKNALNSEEFHGLDPQKQQQVVWELMNRDEQLKPLNDDQRFQYLNEFHKPPEKPGLGDQVEGLVGELPQLGAADLGDALNRLGGTRGARQVASLVRGAVERGVPAALEGIEPVVRTMGSAAKEFVEGGIEQLGGERPDLSLPESDMDAIEHAFRGFNQTAQSIREAGEKLPEVDRTAWKDVGGIFDFADWVAGGAADTIGIMAPSIALTAATGAPIWKTMWTTMSGLQKQEALSEGVHLTDMEIALSGLTQSVLGAKFGVESIWGAAPNSFVKNVFSNGFRKGLWRTAGGVGGEVSTEFMQEYINQQMPKWSEGDQRFWANLNPAEKNEIVEGAALAGVLQIPTSVVGSAQTGWIEDAMDRAEKNMKALNRLRSMTPEERGAEGAIEVPRAVRPLTEQEENDLRVDMAPEWLTDEQTAKWVKGTLDPGQFTEEQQAELAAATEEINKQLQPVEDPNVAPVERGRETRTEQAGLDEVVALATVKQQNLTDEGDTEGAAAIQEAIDTLEIVRPKSSAMGTIKGFAEKHGARVNYFRATNSELLGSNGVSIDTNNGDIFIRWDASVPQAAAAIALHEVVHVISKNNPEAMAALYNTLKTYNPEKVASDEAWLRNAYAENGLTLDEDTMMQEVAAYAAQSRAHEVFAALRMAAHNYEFGVSPGPIKRMIEGAKDVARKAIRAIPKHREIFGEGLDQEFDAKNRRAHEQMLGQLVKFLKLGEAGRKPLDIQPDNFGRRGRKTLKTEAAPVPAPRRPDILEDETPPRTPRITEDKGKKAGKRKPLDLEKVAPPEKRGKDLIVGTEPKVEEETRPAKQQELLKTPSKPAEVKLGKKPVEAVRAPRTPRILMDEPIVRTTAARLEVGDQLEVDNELVSVTRAEPKGKKRVIHYVNQDGDVSTVTVAPNKRFMKFEQPQAPKQGTLFSLPPKEADIHKTNVESDPRYVYHATNSENAEAISQSGLDPHDPWFGTEQDAWPDGATTPRSYFNKNASAVSSFAPEEGYGVILRIKKAEHDFKEESTGDTYTTSLIDADKIEILGSDNKWRPIKEQYKTAAQQKRNVEKMEKEESAIEDAKFSLVVEPLSKAPGSKDKMFKGLSAENKDKMHTIIQEAGAWGIILENVDVFILSDDSGPRGYAYVRERYRDSEYNDREAYVEYIDALYDANGDRIYDVEERYNALGVRNVIEGRRELAKFFPKAIWVGGLRVGGARARAGAPEYMRIPMYGKRARNTGKGLPKWWKKEMISEGSLSQEFLDERHRFDPEGRPVESETSGTQLDRTAPLDPPNYYSFSDGPGHFPPGHTSQTPLYNLHQVNPLSGIDPQSGPSWGLPDASWKSRLITKFQDRFYRVSELQKEIERRHGSIHEDMDAYLHEMLYHGRAADRVEAFEKEFVDPLVNYIRKNDIDVAEFENWLHARHTPERNAHLDEIWEKRKRKILQDEIEQIENEIAYAEAQDIDTTILKRRVYRRKKALAALKENIHHAGMDNDTAASILEAAGTRFNGAAKLFDSMMDQKLKILLDAGLMTKEQFKKISIYKHYVPLKGKEYKGDLEEILEDAGIHTGQGFDIRGDEIGFSFGRVGDNKHTQPILAQAVVDIEEAIVRAEKNEVGKAFLRLVKEFPNDDLYKINTVTRRRVWDAKTGTVRLVKDAFANRADNVIAVKDGEKTHYIDMYDARLASSMKNLGSKPMSQAVKLLARLNRFMAAVNTTFNPEFILTNLIRDVQTAGFNLSTEELKDIQVATMKGIPFAANGIRKAEGLTKQSESEVAKDEWAKYYREYVEDGGKIGFFGYTDVHEKAKSIHRKIKNAGKSPANITFTYMQQIGDLVSSSNSAVENAARLSAYVAARNKGVSRKRAAALGRNLTVNFNKKGDAGQFMNALWLFSNASIQGAFRMGTALKSKRVQKMVGAQIMASFAMAAANRGLGGEDEEDGTPWWEKIGDWQKERNFIVMLDDGNHVKIPLPYGYNVFHVLGTELEAMSHATMTGTMTPERAVRAGMNMFNALMTAFNPLGGASLDTKWQSLRFVVPSAFAPIADTLVNETYYGAPIHPVRSSWDYSPDSQRYFRSATTASKELTAFLNRWTGGSEYESGWWDQNPENLDYLVGAYAGAGPKTVLRGIVDAKWALEALRGEDTSKYEANDMAFLRRVYGEVNDNTVAGVYYENIEGLSQGEKAYKNLEGQQLRDWKEDNAWKIPLFKKLSQAQKGIRDTDDPDAKNRIRKRFNKSYREAWLSQFD